MTSFGSLPNMFERTLTVGSIGKSFSCTGWRLGYVIGSEELLKPLVRDWQYQVHQASTHLQEASAIGFETEHGSENNYWKELTSDLYEKKVKILKALSEKGFTPMNPKAGYFLCFDGSSLIQKFGIGESECIGMDFVKRMIEEQGIGFIPVGMFYGDQTELKKSPILRLCFARDDFIIDRALQIINSL